MTYYQNTKMDAYEYIMIRNGRKIKITGTSVDKIAIKVVTFLANQGEKAEMESTKQAIVNQLKFVPLKKTKPSKPKLSEAYHASLALFRFAGQKTIDQKELDERQEICQNCPLRDTSTFCTGCGGLGKATMMLNDARRLTKKQLVFNPKMKTQFCGVCGCSLPLLLATNKEYLPDDDPIQSQMRPDNCWIKK